MAAEPGSLPALSAAVISSPPVTLVGSGLQGLFTNRSKPALRGGGGADEPAVPPSRVTQKGKLTMNRRRSRSRSAQDRGTAAVEFALVLPLLLLVVLGIIDFGRALNAQITLTQAAREGARLAALGQPNVVGQTQAAATGLSPVTVTVTRCPAGPAPAPTGVSRSATRSRSSPPSGR